MLMLAAPLFGDLKAQIYVKLFTLTLQTICFLFLCSIAPETGFGKMKPKICKLNYFIVLFLSFYDLLDCLLVFSHQVKTVIYVFF